MIKLFAQLLLWYYVVFQGQNKYLYSHLSNKCTEYNKQAGGQFFKKNEQGG